MGDIAGEIRNDPEKGARLLETEYKAGLMTLARRLCADEGDAEELVNRTFAAVVAGIDDYVEQSAFFAWMCQILSHLHSMDQRRKSRRNEVAAPRRRRGAGRGGRGARVRKRRRRAAPGGHRRAPEGHEAGARHALPHGPPARPDRQVPRPPRRDGQVAPALRAERAGAAPRRAEARRADAAAVAAARRRSAGETYSADVSGLAEGVWFARVFAVAGDESMPSVRTERFAAGSVAATPPMHAFVNGAGAIKNVGYFNVREIEIRDVKYPAGTLILIR